MLLGAFFYMIFDTHMHGFLLSIYLRVELLKYAYSASVDNGSFLKVCHIGALQKLLRWFYGQLELRTLLRLTKG